MATSLQEIDGFARFAKEKLEKVKQEDLSLEEILDEWRVNHPPADDLLAIEASLREMENGEHGRAFEEFSQEFRSRNAITGES